MGGYNIPRYVKEYLREWRAYDRLLRVRWSQDVYGAFVLERKTRYLYPPADDMVTRGTDRAIQLTDGYRKVFLFWPGECKYVLASLQRCDVQRYGAKYLGRMLDEDDEREEALLERARIAEFEAIASEHYDRIAWEEKRRVVVMGDVNGN